MSLRVEPVKRNSKDSTRIKQLYKNSFPANEQIPFWFLLWKARKKYIDFSAFYDEDVLVGFTYLISDKDVAFVFYLAIDDKQRSKGYGGLTLSKIRDLYPQNRIILNIEAIDEQANNNEQRIKRKRFYLKNGYKNNGYLVKSGKNWFEVLTKGGDVTPQEYSKLFKKLAGPLLSIFINPKYRNY
ncbi:GNAT family N-acetyltransferase [Salinicoccus hispanicus]|uniref:N-acetyltransferase n=1 Tax=Salinicoccus hispanicus TaxID=157225 RepID=A0A6N8TWA1_9STAP|nr:GNAT family N-acetyltransferase [Salinicoccus hispanicus]MXQ49983.1 N-acetyltransferase [Salinicoccus hispanicus]